MSTSSVASTVGSNELCADQVRAVVVIFFAPTDAPGEGSAQNAGAPPEDLLSERALQRLVVRHGLVITESGAGGAPHYRRVLRCAAESLAEAEELLHTLSSVGILLRRTSYYEGVRCHPLLPNLLIAEHCAPHEIRPAIHAPIHDFAEPEEFLHEAPIYDVDPTWREQAVRELSKLLHL